MRKIEDYRRHAEECRELARGAKTEEHRQMLLNMVATWESLARDRAEQIERLARLETLDNVDGGTADEPG